MRRLALISTGGTIEKTYDELSGVLENRHSVVRQMLALLRLEDTLVRVVPLLSKDSLHMTDADRAGIVQAVRIELAHPDGCDGVVILHGTDTLCVTGQLLHSALADELARARGGMGAAVVLTGAMRPFEMTRSDALQNLTEALFTAGVVAPGVWVAAHGRALRFPGPRKDRARGTFVCDPAIGQERADQQPAV